MDSSKVLRRTPAGDSEVAVPASGLSITQRRILTLLDTPARLDDLAVGQALDPERLCREALRLARAGLIAYDVPVTADAAPLKEAATGVRLGEPRPALRAALALSAIAAGALVWTGWQYAAQRGPSAGSHIERTAKPAAPDRVAPVASPEAVAIATRVLRGEIPEQSRDALRETRAPPAAKPAAAAIPPDTERGNGKEVSSGAAAVTAMNGATRDDATKHGATMVSMHAPEPEATSTTMHSGAHEAASSAGKPTGNAAASAATAPSAAPLQAPLMPPASHAGEQIAASADVAARLASAAPQAVPVPAATLPKLVPVSREAPEFPREAIAQGVARGTVKVRLTVDTQGHVSDVDILDASPHRVFDRVVRNTLSRWMFEPGPGGRTTTVDVAFKRD